MCAQYGMGQSTCDKRERCVHCLSFLSVDDLQAFNTDGFDVTGANVHIHDCNIWNQDDCACVIVCFLVFYGWTHGVRTLLSICDCVHVQWCLCVCECVWACVKVFVCDCDCACVHVVRTGIAIKDGSRDMLIERISCSGLGLVIGSIGASKVQNITFRNAVLPSTVKGIYLKTRWSDSGPVGDDISISDILFENIVMDAPQQYAMYVLRGSP